MGVFSKPFQFNAYFVVVLSITHIISQVYLEASFEESVALPGFETGFRGCIASSNQHFLAPNISLTRHYKENARDTFANEMYNCKNANLGRPWQVHPANSYIGKDQNHLLKLALFQFPVFDVSWQFKNEFLNLKINYFLRRNLYKKTVRVFYYSELLRISTSMLYLSGQYQDKFLKGKINWRHSNR